MLTAEEFDLRTKKHLNEIETIFINNENRYTPESRQIFIDYWSKPRGAGHGKQCTHKCDTCVRAETVTRDIRRQVLSLKLHLFPDTLNTPKKQKKSNSGQSSSSSGQSSSSSGSSGDSQAPKRKNPSEEIQQLKNHRDFLIAELENVKESTKAEITKLKSELTVNKNKCARLEGELATIHEKENAGVQTILARHMGSNKRSKKSRASTDCEGYIPTDEELFGTTDES